MDVTDWTIEKTMRAQYFLEALDDPQSVKIKSIQDDIPDLKITDQLVKVPLDPKADYPQVLVFSAQREKATHDFYAQIARILKSTEIGEMFHAFAKEELRHKYLLEKEYDDIVLNEM